MLPSISGCNVLRKIWQSRTRSPRNVLKLNGSSSSKIAAKDQSSIHPYFIHIQNVLSACEANSLFKIHFKQRKFSIENVLFSTLHTVFCQLNDKAHDKIMTKRCIFLLDEEKYLFLISDLDKKSLNIKYASLSKLYKMIQWTILKLFVLFKDIFFLFSLFALKRYCIIRLVPVLDFL